MKPAVFLALLLLPGLASSAEVKPAATPPDFTTNPTLRPVQSTIGHSAHGTRGWYFTAKGHSREARQILVTEVATGSPADGVFSKSDVILGVNGAPFSDDARVQFAKAITAAEASGGELKLLRWRAGQSEAVTLRLPCSAPTVPPLPMIARNRSASSNSAAPLWPSGWPRRITRRASIRSRVRSTPSPCSRAATRPTCRSSRGGGMGRGLHHGRISLLVLRLPHDLSRGVCRDHG